MSLTKAEVDLGVEHSHLVQKKFNSGLTAEEEQRLAEVRFQLDELEKERIGPHLDRLEKLVDKLVKVSESVATLTYLAELLGSADANAKVANGSTTISMLLSLSRHPSSVVREGSVYGMEPHIGHAKVKARLQEIAESDPSPGVKLAATEALSD